MRWMVLSVAAALCGPGGVACGGGGAGSGSDAAEVTTTLPASTRGDGPREADAAGAPLPADAAPADAAPADAAPDASLRPDASPFGASCGQEDECDSNVCADFRCSVACDPDDPRACRDVLGLCARWREGRHACLGDVASGPDGDDARLAPDAPTAWATLAPGDVDVFRLAVPPGAWRVVATPGAALDLALDFYDARARLLGTSDDGVASASEAATWTASDDEGAFAVVRHVAGVPGGYTVHLEAVGR